RLPSLTTACRLTYMPDPSAFHRVGPTLQRQDQHYNRVIRRVICHFTITYLALHKRPPGTHPPTPETTPPPSNTQLPQRITTTGRESNTHSRSSPTAQSVRKTGLGLENRGQVVQIHIAISVGVGRRRRVVEELTIGIPG